MTEIAESGPPPGADGQPPGEPARSVPGQPDMWVLVLFEALVFTAYFAVYLYHRAAYSGLFLRSQSALSPWLGTLDTLLLLTSSMLMLRCVQAARAGAFRSATVNAYLTAALGAAFLILKITEWFLLVRGGRTFASNQFFMYYFFLTGIHLLHLLIGFITLGVIIYQLRSPQRRSPELIETCATYWHTVDLLWVLIFSLLYVVR
jgi:nitric oxide reductase NorE protein